MINKFNLLVSFVCLVVCIQYANSIDVNTTSGVVRGLTIDVLNTSVDQFLGIPYAEPPVGALRFAKPVPIKTPKKNVIDGTILGNSCMQIEDPDAKKLLPNLTYSEDCLVLNVWTPNAVNKSLSSSEAPALRPVMFYIHGGGLSSGTIFLMTAYNGSVLATHDVVIVSTNYRLGPFGYLYAGVESAPGNVGFFDQLLALKWVRENIHLFGGDRDQITIFGESAGSWSVSVQIFSPLTKGLYKRAIMQSGAHMYNKDRDVISQSEAVLQAKQMAVQLNCTDSGQWLQCLRGVDAEEVLMYELALTFPVLGTEYLPLSAQKAFLDNKFNSDIDLMAGVIQNEGSSLSSVIEKHIENMTVNGFKE
ncbi:unnamed protein product, partial [Oppiella nova]